MNLKKKGSFILIALLVVICVFPAYASNTDKINQAKEEQNKAQQDLNSAQSEISSLSTAKQDLETYITDLNEQYIELNTNLSELEEQSAQKQEELETTQQELEEAKEQEEQQYEDMKKRIRFMYEKSSSDFIELLFASDSFAEFLNRAENISKISDYDRSMLIAYEETKNEIALKEEQVSEEKQEIAKLQEETTQKQGEIEELLAVSADKVNEYVTMIANAETRAAGFQATISSQQSIIDDLLRKQEEEEQRIKAEQVRKAELEQASNQTVVSQNNTQNTGTGGSSGTTQSNNSNNSSKPSGSSNGNTTGNNGGNTGGDNSSGGSPSGGSSSGNSNSGGGNTDQGSGSGSASGYTDTAKLAAIIQCEAGGESYEGMVAVGAVVMNRVRSSSFPGSIESVIMQSGQFSPVASGRYLTVLTQGPNSSCVSAAQEAMGGRDNVNGALYFKYADGSPGLVIGNHVFY